MVTGSPFLFTVSCGEPIEGVAFTAALSRMSLPSEMPPSIPPAWLLFFSMPPCPGQKASLSSLPRLVLTSKPSPNSTPFTAPILMTAFASSASSLSKTGSPSPGNIPVTRQLTVPPSESLACITSFKYAAARAAASASGMPSGFSAQTASSKVAASIAPTALT